MQGYKKKKILWVVYDFNQAGGQRYVYEICKALNKEKYQVDILKVSALGFDTNWSSEYYYEPTLALECRILILPELLSEFRLKNKSASGIIGRLKAAIGRRLSSTDQKPGEAGASLISTLFQEYDVINFSGASVYQVTCIANGLHPEKSIIHILSFSFQDELMYAAFDKNLHYNFVSPVTPEAIKKDLREFTDYSYRYFPLCFETIPYQVSKELIHDHYTIAIFTRLSDRKPLDPFFYTFKILLEKGIKVKLEIYGAGDPEALGIRKQLRYLYIDNHVIFKGHCENIPETLINNPPDLIWFQSANREPGGYAALEISMSGIPQVFWDFMDLGISRPIENVFPSFTEILKFAEYTENLLIDQAGRTHLGNSQRDYVLREYSVKDHIHLLETIYDSR